MTIKQASSAKTSNVATLDGAKELVAQSLNDNGCIAYDVFEQLFKDVLMICETWKDAESLDAHESSTFGPGS